MKKKLFTLMTLLLCAVTGAWAADYYTPSADEVIILNSVYDATKTDAGYSNHAGVKYYSASASFTSATAGDPANSGAATSSKVQCFQIKNNGATKQVDLIISGCSKVILYHNQHNSRYPQLLLTPSEGAASTLSGEKNVLYNEFDIDGTKSYTIRLQGYDGSSNQDLNVYAVKLIKYVAASTVPGGVTFNPVSGSSVMAGTTISLAADGATGYKYKWTNSTATPADGWSDGAEATVPAYGSENVYLHAYGTNDIGGGAASYAQYTIIPAKVATPAITVYGSKVVKIECDTENAAISYKFNDGEWTDYTTMFTATVSGTIYAKATKSGYSDSDEASQSITVPVVGDVIGGLISTVQPSSQTDGTTTFDDITISSTATFAANGRGTYPNHFKTSGTVTLTAANGKTIKSIKIIGTSNDNSNVATITAGDGASVISSPAELMARDVKVGEEQILSEVVITVDEPAANNSVSFTLGRESRFYVEVYGDVSSVTIAPAYTYTTFCSDKALDFTDVVGLEAYAVTAVDKNAPSVTLTKQTKVPAGEGLIIKKTDSEASASYNVPVIASADAITNKLVGVTTATAINNENGYKHYILVSDDEFQEATEGSTLAAGKAYLRLSIEEAPDLSAASRAFNFVIGEDATGIKAIEKAQQSNGECYNLAGQRVAQPTKGLYIVNGKKVIIK